MDPEAIAVLGGSAALATRILGPTADYIGHGLKDWTERRAANVGRIFEKAGRKLGPDALDAPGIVPPRVLRGTLEEGQFADDELMAEYLGGILASSRSESGRDDRAASLNALIGRLSSYQVRLHYVLYAHAQRVYAASGLDLRLQESRRALYLPFPVLTSAMEFSPDEIREVSTIVSHSMYGLSREQLVGGWCCGVPDFLRRSTRSLSFPSAGMVFSVTATGIELFVAAHGRRGDYYELFADGATEFDFDLSMDLGSGTQFLDDLPPYAGDG